MIRDGTLPEATFEFEVAAEHVSKRVPVASPSSSAGEIRRALDGGGYETMTHVAVLEDGGWPASSRWKTSLRPGRDPRV